MCLAIALFDCFVLSSDVERIKELHVETSPSRREEIMRMQFTFFHSGNVTPQKRAHGASPSLNFSASHCKNIHKHPRALA
jgi:hypothetical protein